jgi:hypothetical protein
LIVFGPFKNKGKIGKYTLKPLVTHENFLNYASWVFLKARAPLEMPCCICGSTEPV